jgi:hypothetical protein
VKKSEDNSGIEAVVKTNGLVRISKATRAGRTSLEEYVMSTGREKKKRRGKWSTTILNLKRVWGIEGGRKEKTTRTRERRHEYKRGKRRRPPASGK